MFQEHFNQHKLNYLIQNSDDLDLCISDDWDPLAIMKGYLDNSKRGVINVSYQNAKGSNKGRSFAVNSRSLQNMPRRIRHSISRDYYADIDMVNAHPTMLLQLCQKNNIDCEELEEYVNNRDGHLKKLMKKNTDLTREDAKTVYLSLLNGGCKAYNAVPHKTSALKLFKIECDEILTRISQVFKKEYELKFKKNKNPENPKGSTLNTLLCDIENKCLMSMVDWFKDHDIIDKDSIMDCVLCFDGIMVPLHRLNESPVDLSEVEKWVYKRTGYKIALKMKEMDEPYDIPDEIDEYHDNEAYYHQIADWSRKQNIDRSALTSWMSEALVSVINRGKMVTFTKNLEEDGSTSYEMLLKPGVGFDYTWTEDTETGSKRYSMDDIYKREVMFQHSYRYFKFHPYLTDEQKAEVPKSTFNMFKGFRYPYNKKAYPLDEQGFPIPPKSIAMWVDHIKNVLAPNGQTVEGVNLSHKVLQWYAHLIQKPREKPFALVFKSMEGTGKGLWQTFFENLLSKTLTQVFTSWDRLTGNFNGGMEGKLLYTLNEVTNYATHKQTEYMKTLIKDMDLEVNKKFENQYHIDNYARIQITTNNNRPVVLKADDRRYCCIKVNNDIVGNTDYFKRLAKTHNNEQVNQDMFDYLANYPLDGFNPEKPPMTTWKKELIGSNITGSVEFVRELIHDEAHLPLCSCYDIDDDDDDIREQVDCCSRWVNGSASIICKQLYAAYIQWSAGNNEVKTLSQRQFNNEIRELGVRERRIKIKGVTSANFILDKQELLNHINTLICKE